ncbi:MAG: hypothetical protein ACRC46_06505 [Thermoguttaceae bacterium]
MRYIALMLVVVSLVVCGCNNGKVSLGGQVTYPDGSPLTQGTICFETGTYLARGAVGKDGKYTVASVSTRDGLPPGTYKVYLTGTTLSERDGPKLKMTPLVNKKYASAETSGLTVEVTASTKTYDFKVDRP